MKKWKSEKILIKLNKKNVQIELKYFIKIFKFFSKKKPKN